MLDTVVDEIICFRERHKASKWVIHIELIAILLSIAIPYLPIDIVIVTLYSFLYPSILLLLGFRRGFTYVLTSFLLLLSTSIPIAMVFGGNILSVYRFSLVALSTLSIGILILASLHPLIFRSNLHLYLLMIMLNSMIREVRDVIKVFRAKGEGGLKLYARSIITAIQIFFAISTTLIDALRARGIEIE